MRTTPTLPMALPARILLLGSGELGKELTIAFQRLGCHVIAADSYPGAPAMQVAHESVVLDMTDGQALSSLLGRVHVDLVVPEVEAIATDELAAVERSGRARVVPNAFAVQATMDRQRIRALADSLSAVRTSAFRFASNVQELREALRHTGLPAFVKPTMSSSGHGQSRITSADQAEEAWERACTQARCHTGRVIVEEEINFDCEITLLTVRSWDPHQGRVVTGFCAPIGHRQEGGDYVESWQPAAVSDAALASARRMAREVTDALAVRGQGPCLGLFGVEFFVAGDEVWFSELSPRPHDTGMVTMASQDQSEFDLHVRAVLGMPVDTALKRPGASAVIMSTGAVEDARYFGVAQALASGAGVRIFGKPVTRADRRLGVALAHGEDVESARSCAFRAADLVTVAPAVASLDA
ncbi:formate-dependent phosphoribosylglycinamide formyltransferase [Schaalia sp. 19OD2882]|uniref:formate-dependent phosphoribosylglycinamide formyltransferase n=1 Tax=Schaalia sp. 19OD2882 TaxID=2794089 RepID=UPI001C1EB17D|nr:formate-dependent phosphoribosylglycinamide formyltransferase [Schaalia sp. 19OD2882]QWW20533.1 formate-dependent phosphoribosylglycinamide formyltransferase [Schaalia sp. 19OD2882]